MHTELVYKSGDNRIIFRNEETVYGYINGEGKFVEDRSYTTVPAGSVERLKLRAETFARNVGYEFEKVLQP